MSIKAFIDPNMFELREEKDILNNLTFFSQVINLCKQQKLNIVVYKGLLEKLKERAIFPFPIDVSKLSDSQLKQNVLQLNQNFNNSMVNSWVSADIDICSGNQEFQSNPNLGDDYFELLSVMTSSCYKCELKDVTQVLIGDINKAQKSGFELELNCSCLSTDFCEKYHWVSPDNFYSVKDKQVIELRKIKFDKCDQPSLNRADHHAPFMPRNTQLRNYKDIPPNSRIVLNILRYFGLNCITLKDFHPDTSETKGTIIISNCEVNETNDIIHGKLFFDRGFRITVELVFPPNVGQCITTFCGKKIDYKTIFELATALTII